MKAFTVDSHHSYSLFLLTLLSLYKKYAAAEQGMNWFISNELASTVRGVESPNLETLENRCPEAVNPRGTPFLVYTQSRPSSLLSWSTGMIPEAVNPRGTPFLVYTQSQPSSLSSWATGMDYSERTEVLRMSTPGGHPSSSTPSLVPPPSSLGLQV
jgi:hypothetical protein